MDKTFLKIGDKINLSKPVLNMSTSDNTICGENFIVEDFWDYHGLKLVYIRDDNNNQFLARVYEVEDSCTS